MNSSHNLIKANGHLYNKPPAAGWLPLELTAPPQNGTRLHAKSHPISVGMPFPTDLTDATNLSAQPKREPTPWQPANVSAFTPLATPNGHVTPPPVLVHSPARETSPDLTDLRKHVLEEATAEGQARAAQLVQTAEQQAADIVAKAKAQAAEITRQARDNGLAAAQTEAERLLRTSQTIVDEVHAWRESMLAQSEAAVLNLVTDIGRTLFGNGLTLAPETLRETFTRALSEAKQLGSLLVHLHPADVTVLDQAWLETQTSSRAARVELVPDPTIRRGGCLVEGEFGQVDARVETKCAIVEQVLVGAFTKPEGATA
ncbi:MAG: hypothetical protein H6636_04455 [Anaerolineales bacterium]|nr:hypothetical protein [Anaerolineales bacterium]